MPDLLTAQQAADALELHILTVRKLAESGELPGSEVDGQWRFRQEVVDNWGRAPVEPPEPGAADDTGESSSGYGDDLRAESAYWMATQHRRLAENEITPELDLRRSVSLGRRRLSDPYGGPDYFFDPALLRYCLPVVKLYAVQREAGAQGGRGLDVGSGAGWLALEMARDGVEMDACDISAGSIAIASRLAREDPWRDSRAPIRYRVEDMNHLELPSEEYDAITVWFSMHHCARPRRVFAEINRALKPEGRAYIVDGTDRCRSGRILGLLLHTFLPTTRPLREKWGKLWARVRAKLSKGDPPATQGTSYESPMEGLCDFDEMVALAGEELQVERVSTLDAFCYELAYYTVIPTPLRQPLLFLLGVADYAMTRVGLMRGQHGIIRARKRG